MKKQTKKARIKQLEDIRDRMRKGMSNDKYLDDNYIHLKELCCDIIEIQSRIEELGGDCR